MAAKAVTVRVFTTLTCRAVVAKMLPFASFVVALLSFGCGVSSEPPAIVARSIRISGETPPVDELDEKIELKAAKWACFILAL